MSKENVDVAIGIIESTIRRLDTWVLLCAALVAIGVVGESILGIWHWRMDRQLRPLREAQSQFHEKEIETLKSATAKAELDAAKLMAQLAPRSLTKSQFDELQTLRGKVCRVIVTTLMGDSESKSFGQTISDALQYAGIKVTIGDPRSVLPWSGVTVILPGAESDPKNDPVAVAFAKSGIASFAGPGKSTPLGDSPLNVPLILIGQRDTSPPFTNSGVLKEASDTVNASGSRK